ncbi:MAG: metallophosphoesterase [Oligoflexales bacterium]|nr:metallophosphoesterase [Oligoflexales bacterium]
MFGIIITVTYSILLIYVFWRAATVPMFARHLSRKISLGSLFVLWLIFVLGRYFEHGATVKATLIFEMIGMILLGSIFIISTLLLIVDLFTVFGAIFKNLVPILRSSAIVIGIFLSCVALLQGLRSPVVTSYDVALLGLPDDLNGKILVALSDAHIGSILGNEWFSERVLEIAELKPDILAFVGDMFEGHGAILQDVTALRELSVPLGKWFVDGNHDTYGRNKVADEIWEKAGFRRLDNQSTELAPGLILAGVKDLTNLKHQGINENPLDMVLTQRKAGATILLSHTPWYADFAAQAGVQLMISGHTHDGQIWPFSYLVKTIYPLLSGRYNIGGMTVIVSRGVGTWGPRMRLWNRGEILKITLHPLK